MWRNRRGLSVAVVLLSVWVAGFLGAGAAVAHVSVSSPDAVQGGYATVVFTVPTESEAASTTRFKVQLPPDQPLASVSVLPIYGWTYTVTKAKLAAPIKSDDGDVTEAISVIDWKATSAQTATKPGEFSQFTISAGPLPKAPSMTFKAIQTYSDGSAVSWIEEAAAGSSTEPEHPAPTLRLSPATGDGTTAGATASGTATAGSAGTTGATASAPVVSSSSNGGGDTTRANTALALAAVAVLLGGIALAAALLGRRPRRTP